MAKRRAKGTGTIIQNKDGGYIARIKIDGKQKSKRAKTKAEANRKLKELQEEAERQKKRKTLNFTELTVEEYFRMFLEYKKEQLGSVSYRRLESTIDTHIIEHFDCMLMRDLTDDLIQERLREAKDEGLSHSSVKKIYEAFTGCYKFAVNIKRDMSFKDNPMLGVTMIPEKKFEQRNNSKRILINDEDNNERQRFVEEALRTYKNGKQVYRYGPALVFILNTGIREGEMCGLFESNIDTVKKIAYIVDTAETIKDDNGKYITRIRSNETKYTSERHIPLNEMALKMLELMRESFPHKEGLPLIYSTKNNILPTQELVKTFKRVCSGADIGDIDGIGCHCLRHTFASSLFEQMVDIKIISELLGHSSTTVTENTYITVINRLKAEALNLPQI